MKNHNVYRCDGDKFKWNVQRAQFTLDDKLAGGGREAGGGTDAMRKKTRGTSVHL